MAVAIVARCGSDSSSGSDSFSGSHSSSGSDGDSSSSGSSREGSSSTGGDGYYIASSMAVPSHFYLNPYSPKPLPGSS